VRLATILGVIAVHSTSLTAARSSDAAGGVLDVLHVTRSVFLFLSAFVLGYSFRRRPLGRRAFWKRRYPLVLAPYVTWSAIYVLTDGDLRSPLHVIGTFSLDLLDGGAHFHLYFLLLTFQLYLVFPALIAFFTTHPRLQRPILAATVVWELAFTAAIHYGWRPTVLSIWFEHPGSWLPSYSIYVVGGVLAALHFESLTVWVRRHSRAIGVAFVASLALCAGSYVADLTLVGYGPIRASQVFQPTNVIEAVAAIFAQYALGLALVDRLRPSALAFLQRASDVSFGVYLAHPLLVGAILDVAAWSGLSARMSSLPSGLIELVAVVGLVPFVYAVVFVAIDALRRTPLSLALTGRRRPRPDFTPALAAADDGVAARPLLSRPPRRSSQPLPVRRRGGRGALGGLSPEQGDA
jgi:peptidoglycan/LPS O-acetylase OafA/YrhL